MTAQRTSPVWHPFTQHALQPSALNIAEAEGAWLTTSDGRKILDAISSWWVTTHGHRHPKIVAAIKQQADRLDQVIFANLTHEPAETVARGLIDITPASLTHVFFSDSGSTSVEVALKMALGYWHNIGAPRTRIIAMEHGYHGDTVGTMSAGARGIFSAPYAPLLFDVTHIPFPEKGREQDTLDALEKACSTNPVAALLIEPLILGAGGMKMYPPEILAELKNICERHGALFIADEVMTGFGRTGTLFAFQQADITPDIVCVAKGMTGGTIPLAATLCTEPVFEAHLSTDRTKTFFHSSSYTANPIACAAAAANLDIWKTEPVLERIEDLKSTQAKGLATTTAHPRTENHRQIGTIAAFDVRVKKEGYLADIGLKLAAFALERGILIRPLGNTVYLMPPYCVKPDELACVYDVILQALDEK